MAVPLYPGDLNDLLQCALCCLRYSEPRVLPCQHTFCTHCLAKYYEARQVSSRRKIAAIPCPTCKSIALVPRQGVAAFPADHKVQKVKELVDYVMLQSALNKCNVSMNAEDAPRNGDDDDEEDDEEERILSPTNGKVNDENVMPSSEKPSVVKRRQKAFGDDKARPSSTTSLDWETHTIDETDSSIIVGNGDSNQSASNKQTGTEKGKSVFNFRRFLSRNRRKTVSGQECSPTKPDVDGSNEATNEPNNETMSPADGANDATNDDGSAKSTSEKTHFEFPSFLRKPVVKRTRKRRRNDVTSETTDTATDSKSNDVSPDSNNNKCRLSQSPSYMSPSSQTSRISIDDDDETIDVEYQIETSVGSAEDTMSGGSAMHVDDSKETNASKAQLLWQVEKLNYKMPTGITFLADDLVAVAEYGHNLVEYYDYKGNLLRNVDDVKPFGVTTDQQGAVIVTDRKEQTVKLYDREAQLMFHMDKDKFKWTSGIAVNSKGQYVMCDRDKSKIAIYESTGESVVEFGSYGKGDMQLCMADFIAVDSHDRIIICDSANHAVKIFDDTGRFIAKCGGRGTEDGQMLWPKGICVDSSDNIFVCDTRNDRISLYSAGGDFIRHVLENWKRPYSVAYKAPNLIGVTRYSLSGKSSVAMYSI